MGYTKEQKEAWKAQMSALSKKLAAMPKSEREQIAAEMGTITAEGHLLSVNNCVLLWMQAGRPLIQVGGFKQWQKTGRVVCKGQHSIGSIYVPMKGKAREDDEEKDEKKKRRIRFRLVPVFELEQTEAA